MCTQRVGRTTFVRQSLNAFLTVDPGNCIVPRPGVEVARYVPCCGVELELQLPQRCRGHPERFP
jgi:hypothetical protein